MGTAAGLVSVSSIRYASKKTSYKFVAEGPCHQTLSAMFNGIQRGEVEDRFGWCEPLRYQDYA